MAGSLVVGSRFNGPRSSGNGGYASGLIAAFCGGRAEVTLRSPVPLDTELAVEAHDDGVRVLDGETLIAEARPVADIGTTPPAPVGLEEARVAREGYRGLADGPFSECFVCGRAREDAFGVFAGNVAGREGVVATPWTPDRATADDEGDVRPEFVWAVLDCPTYFALYTEGDLPASVMGRFAVSVKAPVRAGVEHVVIGWEMEADGRKRHAGSAVLSASGETLAVGHALLIEPRSAKP